MVKARAWNQKIGKTCLLLTGSLLSLTQEPSFFFFFLVCYWILASPFLHKWLEKHEGTYKNIYLFYFKVCWNRKEFRIMQWQGDSKWMNWLNKGCIQSCGWVSMVILASLNWTEQGPGWSLHLYSFTNRDFILHEKQSMAQWKGLPCNLRWG